MSNFLVKDGDKANWEIPEGYPHKEQNETVLLEEVLTLTGTDDGTTSTTWAFSFIPGQTYKVVYDGVEYVCVAMKYPNSLQYAILGNLSLMNAGYDTGEPFIFVGASGGYDVIANSAGEHTVTIIGQTAVYHTIDPNFIPIVTEENAGAIKIYNFTSKMIDVATMKEAVTAFKAGKCRIFWGGAEFLGADIDDSDNLFVIIKSEPCFKFEYKPINSNGLIFYNQSSGTYLSIGMVRCNDLYIGDYRITVNNDGTLSATKVTT